MLLVAPLILLSGLFQQSAILPDTIPARRLSDFIAAFNTKDQTKIEAMVIHNFSKNALKALTKEEWVSRILDSSNDLAPISVQSLLKSSDSVIVVKLSGNTNQPIGLRLDLESESPFAIDGARLGAPSDIVSASGPKKYSTWTSLVDLAEAVRADNKLPAVWIAYQKMGEKPNIASAGLRNTRITEGMVNMDDRLLVGSIGKAMTATMIAHLIDLNKLSWKTTIGEMLPDIPMKDAYKTVTIDQLLHHRGGLPQDLRISQEQLTKIVGTAQTPTEIRKAYVKDVLMRDPIGPVDGQMKYSNADYVVLGYIAEKHIRQSYEYLMDRYVFQPMKLTTAMIAPVCSPGQVGSAHNVVGHLLNDFGYSPYDIGTPELDEMMAPAGGGISCSIGDLLKFAEFHLRGLSGDAQVLSEASYQKLHEPGQGEGKDQYACGWVINPPFSSEPCDWHNGSNGSFYADMTIWPKSGLAIVAITNAGTTKQPSPTLQAILAVRDRLESK